MSLGIIKKVSTENGKVNLWITHTNGYTWIYDNDGNYHPYTWYEKEYGPALTGFVKDGDYKLVAPECLGVW